MVNNWCIDFDLDDAGYIRTIKGEQYRFSITIPDPDAPGLSAVTIHGFRIDKRFTRIFPPMAQGQHRALNIVVLGLETEKALLERIRGAFPENSMTHAVMADIS